MVARVVMLKTEHTFRFATTDRTMPSPSQRPPISTRPRRATSRRTSGSVDPSPIDANVALACDLERIAELLEERGEAEHRVSAYRQAGRSLRELRRDVRDIARRGERALRSVPSVGPRLAPLLYEHVRTGTIRLLERLEAERRPREALEALPGIGEALADRLVGELHVASLEDLELAAHDGRLAATEGFGDRRVASLRTGLNRMLGRRARGERARSPLGRRRAARDADPIVEAPEPLRVPVGLLLELDARYRMLAAEGKLRRIAPHRFNPDQLAWLPVMVDHREGWRFDVMYSNSARAHRLDKTRDWVIVRHRPAANGAGMADFGDDEVDDLDEPDAAMLRAEGSHTIVTETRGADAGLRVVRGRERECHEHHVEHPPKRPKLELPDFLKPTSRDP